MPFQWQPYEPANSTTIAQLMMAPAQIRAQAMRSAGQARANEIGGVGQAATNTIGSILQQRQDAPRREMEQLQLQEARRQVQQQQDADKRGKDFAQWVQSRPTPPTMQDAIARYGAHASAFEPLISAMGPKPMTVKGDESVIDSRNPSGPALFQGVKEPKTREVTIENADGSKTIKIVPDEVGSTFQSAKPPVNDNTPGAAENKYLGIQTKLNQGEPLTAAEQAFSKAYEKNKNLTSTNTFNLNQQKSQFPGDFNKAGDDFLETIPAQWRTTVKKLAHYDEDPTKVASMRGGNREMLMAWVNQVNPEYDASMFTNRAPTRKAFTTGTQGQQINAINTAIGHIDQLQGVAEALANGSFVPGNKLWNSIKTTFGQAAPTNFDTLKDALAGEVASVLSKGGATVSGIADAKEKINTSSSPAALAGYVKTLIPIMGSKLNEFNFQYHQAMGDSDPYQALSPESKRILTARGFDPEHPTIAQGTTAPPAAAAVPEGRVRVQGPNGERGTITKGDTMPPGWKVVP